MKKIVFLLVVLAVHLSALQIDECKIDLYYANGIMMQDDEKQARNDWQERVDDLLSEYPYFQKNVGTIEVAYNMSDGMVADMWESFLQKVDLDQN